MALRSDRSCLQPLDHAVFAKEIPDLLLTKSDASIKSLESVALSDGSGEPTGRAGVRTFR